jgi:lysophospholipase L1-like esterase
MISGLFPRTRKKLSRLFDKIGGTRAQRPDCRPRILEAVDAFIRNQSVVRDLALARGSGYLLALQPFIHFIVPPTKERAIEEAELRRIFYRRVMESPFCQAAECLDFSETFRDAVPLQASETPEDPNRAIFVDKVHLTDHGNVLIAEQLNSMIRR